MIFQCQKCKEEYTVSTNDFVRGVFADNMVKTIRCAPCENIIESVVINSATDNFEIFDRDKHKNYLFIEVSSSVIS